MATRKRRCIRKKTVTILQSHGPAKKLRVCAKFAKVGTARATKRRRKSTRRSRWCVYKGKRKGVQLSCHTNKRSAKHAAAVARKGCRARIRVRRAKKS